MSAIAATTGPSILTLTAALRHRGPELQTFKSETYHVTTLGRQSESQTFLNGEAKLILSGQISAPLDILDRLQKNLKEGLNSCHGPGIAIYQTGKKLIIARDGAGGRALNYTFGGGHFSCASETKALLALPNQLRTLRPGALAQFLAYSFIPGPKTMLDGIFSLPAGSYLEINLDYPTPTDPVSWFFPEFIEPHLTKEESTEAFQTTFQHAVERLLPQAGPSPALFLSGGLDSSCVAAELARNHRDSLHSYSLHFGENYPHELDHARDVVAFCGIKNHHEILIRPKDFITRLHDMVAALDEPIGDPVALPNYELASRVGQNHPAVFNGEGGDPIFGGPKNFNLLLHHWYGLPQHCQNPNHREKQYLSSYRRAYEEISRLLTPEFRELFHEEEELEGPLTPFFEASQPTHFLNKVMIINQRLKGAHLIQPKVERMLAAHKLRPLSPLFDENIIRLSFAIPPTCKLLGGHEKIIMKRAFAGRLPNSILERPKSGMRVPVHFWMQKEMKSHVREILSPRQLKQEGIFDHHRVKQLLKYKTEEGPGRYGLRLWMLMTFQLWKSHFKV
jgi:asparagine synthase (glutamine-hydrolysing)